MSYIRIIFAFAFTLSVALSLPVEDLKKDIYDEVIEEIDNNIEGELVEAATEDTDIIDISHLDRSIFGKPDNQTTGIRVAEFGPNSNVNPEELGSYLEGDMLIPPTPSRNGMLSRTLRWPNGNIPFEIRGSFSAVEMARIEQGINEYHAKTCIRFKPRSNEKDYISIVNQQSGCWSNIGKVGGKQELNLQTPGCLARGSGTFMHEMMHALGFLHEQNRHERDSYITVQYKNIDSKAVHNFYKASASQTYAFGVPYDYSSIMHYSAYAFSSNGQPTIIPNQKTSQMGQRNGFSSYDLQKINAMYRCSRTSGFLSNKISTQQQETTTANSNKNPILNLINGFLSG